MNEAKEIENQVVDQNIDSEKNGNTEASEEIVNNEETKTSDVKPEVSSTSNEETTDKAEEEKDQTESENDVSEVDENVTEASEEQTVTESKEETETNEVSTADAKEEEESEKEEESTVANGEETEISDEEVSAEETVAESEDTETESEATEESEQAEDTEEIASTEETDETETETAEESVETEPEPEEELDVPESLEHYQEIVGKGKEVAESSEWQYASLEFDNLRHKWSEGPEVEEDDEEIYKKLNDRFQQSLELFNERKSRHYDEMNRQKLKNLEHKKNLLERLEKIIDNKKWHAYNEIKGIQKRWDNIRMLPPGEGDKLESRYKQLQQIFEENRVEYLVQRKQKEEDNLQVKLLILDKMELIFKNIDDKVDDWGGVEKEYQELLREWKKVGRVPREKSGELWQRYKAVRSGYIEKKLEYNEDYRKQVESNIKKKVKLCEEAEALLEDEDLASAARTINKLHKRWKETGPVPREKAEDLWNRFKSASDAFNKEKSDNIELLRTQEKENYESKLELCAKAESIQDTDDWKGGTKAMQDLMETWKEIGPVPRRKTRKIWKRFKKAMDVFYQRKRDFYKELRIEQRENLKKKRAIIDKIRALGEMENAQEAVKEAKPLQAEFAKIGYVPLKHKNKIYKHYREACDVVYQRARAERSQGLVPGGRNSNLDPESRKAIKRKSTELVKLRKQCNELKDTILKYQDSKTFFKPNKKGMKLREEIQAKIDGAEKQLEDKLDKIDELSQEIETIKQNDDE
ncbi:MAG TPA: DUF349 domain-containing protein [Balneolales bacterium]|nr:DUF349 domain-containing protein [Balneolales bacterium]